MFKLLTRRYSSKELKDSVVGTAKSIAKDAKMVSVAASQPLQDDFHSIGQAVADSSNRIKQTVHGSSKKEQEDKNFHFHAEKENIKEKISGNKEDIKEKMADFKDTVKSSYEKSKESAIRAQHSNEGFSEQRESMAQKMEHMAENAFGKVKETVASVKDSLKGNTQPKDTQPPVASPLDAAKINPMARDPNHPLLNKETEELQKKGAEGKAKDDSFNLM